MKRSWLWSSLFTCMAVLPLLPVPSVWAAAEAAAQAPVAADRAHGGTPGAHDGTVEDRAERLDERLDELLEKTLVPGEYGVTRSCLYSRAYRKVRVLNDRVLLFEGGNRYWLNRLKRKCAGLRRDMVVTMQSAGRSTCAADRAQGLIRVSGPPVGSAICSLGSFEEIDPLHAQALLQTLH